MKPEHMSAAAILLTIVAGGGGFGWNVASNREVSAKLDELRIQVVEFRGDLKANQAEAVRLETAHEEARRDLKALQDSVVSLERRVTVLESKSGQSGH